MRDTKYGHSLGSLFCQHCKLGHMTWMGLARCSLRHRLRGKR